MREFYANLSKQEDKKVWVRGVRFPSDRATINSFYHIPHVNDEEYQRLCVEPNYLDIIKCLTSGKGEWKINSVGQVMNFKAKHLTSNPKAWHHFITSRLIPSTNVCEVTKEQAILNYAILQDIKFDVECFVLIRMLNLFQSIGIKVV